MKLPREAFISLILVVESKNLHEFLLENRTEFDSLIAPRVRREKSVFDFDSLDDFNYPDMVSELSEISTFLSSSSFVEDLKQPKILWAVQYASILSILEENNMCLLTLSNLL